MKSRVQGVLSLEAIRKKIPNEFLRGAVAFLVDNYKERDIRERFIEEARALANPQAGLGWRAVGRRRRGQTAPRPRTLRTVTSGPMRTQ